MNQYLLYLDDCVTYLHPLSPYLYYLAVYSAISVVIYFLFCYKLARICTLEDIGYISFDGKSKCLTANLARKLRKVGSPPPVYPNGWYMIMESFRLKRGEAESVNMIGLALAVFRDQTGEVYVVDAYCPHLGANLGMGGRVHGNCIECPFHSWRFRGTDGKCVNIPALDQKEKIPEYAKVKSYIVREINEQIYLWFDAEGRAPTWNLPDLTEISNGNWSYKGKTEHMVNCHIEEINENGCDIAHLSAMHDASFFAGTDLRYIFNKWINALLHQKFTATWEVNKSEPWCSVMHLLHRTYICGNNFKPVEMYVDANQLGPAVVYLEFNTLFGRGVFLHSVTPVEPLILKVTHNIYMSKWVPCVVSNIYLRGEAFQLERDIMVWNNKEYRDKPTLAKSTADQYIVKHRRWYSQFYSENSPRWQDGGSQRANVAVVSPCSNGSAKVATESW